MTREEYKMNITQLKYFHAVAIYHTVSLAAQHLYISQPSLSNAIASLEKEFSVSLFYRRYNGMFLTPEGTKLYNSTKELILHFDEVEAMMHSIGEDKKSLRLGIPPMISSIIFSKIYRDFIPKNPDVEISITEKGRYELLDKLNEGLVDVVLLPHTKSLDPGLLAKKIGTLEVVCCMSPENPMSQRDSITPDMLRGLPLVLFSDSFFQTKTIRDWFAMAGVEPTVSVQTEQLSTAQSLMENNLAVGFMFKELAQKNQALTTVSLSPAVFLDVSVIRKKDSYLFDSAKRFEDYLKANTLF